MATVRRPRHQKIQAAMATPVAGHRNDRVVNTPSSAPGHRPRRPRESAASRQARPAAEYPCKHILTGQKRSANLTHDHGPGVGMIEIGAREGAAHPAFRSVRSRRVAAGRPALLTHALRAGILEALGPAASPDSGNGLPAPAEQVPADCRTARHPDAFDTAAPDPFGLETRVDTGQTAEALQQHAGGHQQHHAIATWPATRPAGGVAVAMTLVSGHRGGRVTAQAVTSNARSTPIER